jgi:hypothetical protein
MDATQLPRCPGKGPRSGCASSSPAAPPRLRLTPRARQKAKGKNSDGAAPPPIASPPLLSPPRHQAHHRLLCYSSLARFSAAALVAAACVRRDGSAGPVVSPARAGWPGRPRPRGSPCGSRPSRPTSAVTAGERRSSYRLLCGSPCIIGLHAQLPSCVGVLIICFPVLLQVHLQRQDAVRQAG